MRPAVPDKRVKFRYPHSKRSREIRLEAIRGGILDKFQLNAVNGVMSDVIVDYTSADAHVKLGDRRSNRSRDIRAAHFAMDDERRRTHVMT